MNKRVRQYVGLISAVLKGCFKRVDDETHDVILMDGTVIPAEGLFSINGKIFEEM